MFQLYSFQLAMGQNYLVMNVVVRSCFFSDRHHDAPDFLLTFYNFQTSLIHKSGIILAGIERGR
jgi:hypothetical protein